MTRFPNPLFDIHGSWATCLILRKLYIVLSLSRVYVSWRLESALFTNPNKTIQMQGRMCGLCFFPNTSGRVCKRDTRIFINTIKIETRARVCVRAKAAHFHTGNVALLATCSLWRKKNCGAPGKFSLLFLFFSSEWCKPSRDNQQCCCCVLQINILQNTQI